MYVDGVDVFVANVPDITRNEIHGYIELIKKEDHFKPARLVISRDSNGRTVLEGFMGIMEDMEESEESEDG